MTRARQHEHARIGDLDGLHQASGGERLLHLGLRPVAEQRGHHRSGADRIPTRKSTPLTGRDPKMLLRADQASDPQG